MKKIGDSEDTILTVEDFQKTQGLIDEFNQLKTKRDNFENEITENDKIIKKEKKELRAKNKEEIALLEKRIKLIEEREFAKDWEDEEFNLDEEEVKKEFELKKQADIDEVNGKINDLKAELKAEIRKKDAEKKEKNNNLQKDINEVEEQRKFFRTDEHIKTITMEIESIKTEIRKQEVILRKKDDELQEFYQQDNTDDPLKWQNIYKEQDEIKSNINELNNKLEEYAKFKDELLSIEFTPDDFKKMYEIENKQPVVEDQKAEQEESKQEEPEAEDIKEEEAKEEQEQEEPKQEEQKQEEPVQPKPVEPRTAESRPQEPVQARPTEPLPKENKKLEIIISNTGIIKYGNETFDISTETIRQGLLHNNRDKSERTRISMDLPGSITKMLEKVDEDMPIDYTVIFGIRDSEIPFEDRNQLIQNYINNVIKMQSEYKKTNDGADIEFSKMDIKYDINDLSKPLPFWKTLFSRHPEKNNLMGREKQDIVQLANKLTRFNLGTTVGQYKEQKGFGAKVLSLFRKNRKLLPAPENMYVPDSTHKVEQEAANIYNNTANEFTTVTIEDKTGYKKTMSREEYDNLGNIKNDVKVIDTKVNITDHEKFVKSLRDAEDNYVNEEFTDNENIQVKKEIEDLEK